MHQVYIMLMLASNIVFDPVISGVYERQDNRIKSKDCSIREMEISIFIPYRSISSFEKWGVIILIKA